MAQCKAEKLGVLLSLVNLDPNLLFLINIIGHKNFGTLVKTMGGTTISIPSVEELKKIARQVKDYHKSFQRRSRKNTAQAHLALLGLAIDNKDVRTASKAILTKIVFESYLKSVYDDETFQLPVEDIEDDTQETDDKLSMYALSLKELEIRNNILSNINLLSRKN